ncbi:MAG TPA: carboxypeptidase regulatory-like domain-containing protein [candidate division Zixibacteria bacterium]
MKYTYVMTFTAVCAVSIMTGCGGGGDSTTQTPPATPQQQTQQATPPKAATATLAGSVTFSGTAPKNTRIRMDSDPVCGKLHSEPVFTEEYIVGSGGELANVFVYVKSGLDGQGFPATADTVIFDQRGCHYDPHVFGLRVNQPLAILNSDPTLHNVHALAKNSREFNLAMPKEGMRVTKSFSEPEVMVKIKCDVHSWMAAYAGVLPHPHFDVTDESGRFSIGPLPPGTYELEAWHEKAGTMTQTVTVGDGETSATAFTFGASGT